MLIQFKLLISLLFVNLAVSPMPWVADFDIIENIEHKHPFVYDTVLRLSTPTLDSWSVAVRQPGSQNHIEFTLIQNAVTIPVRVFAKFRCQIVKDLIVYPKNRKYICGMLSYVGSGRTQQYFKDKISELGVTESSSLFIIVAVEDECDGIIALKKENENIPIFPLKGTLNSILREFFFDYYKGSIVEYSYRDSKCL